MHAPGEKEAAKRDELPRYGAPNGMVAAVIQIVSWVELRAACGNAGGRRSAARSGEGGGVMNLGSVIARNVEAQHRLATDAMCDARGMRRQSDNICLLNASNRLECISRELQINALRTGRLALEVFYKVIIERRGVGI